MIRIREAIIVEGRYDKNTLAQIVDAPILETSGFGIFHDRQRLALLRRLAETRGIIVLTDSDGAGFVIRNYLRRAGATIEGEETPASGARITKADLYAAGLTGGADSKAARQRLLAQLDLPEHLSTNALLEVLNALMTREEFQKLYI